MRDIDLCWTVSPAAKLESRLRRLEVDRIVKDELVLGEVSCLYAPKLS
jgi:hypothetical protein